MADIAAADLVYTERPGQSELTGSSKVKTVYTVTFGDGTDTYPAGGIPLTKGKLGLPNVIETVNLSEPAAGDGLVYKYDDSAESVRIYRSENDGTDPAALVELVGGTTAVAETSLIIEATGW